MYLFLCDCVIGGGNEKLSHFFSTPQMGQNSHKSLRKSNHVTKHTNNNNPRYYLYVDTTDESEDDPQNHETQQKDIDLWFDKKIFEENVDPLYKRGDTTCFTFLQFDGSTRIDSTIYEQLPIIHHKFQLTTQFFRDYYERYGEDVEPIPPEEETKFDKIQKTQRIRGSKRKCFLNYSSC
jgi:hypothetical protein